MLKSLAARLRPDSKTAATPRLGLNRLCNLEDWNDPVETQYMRQVLPHFASAYPAYPKGFEHRKHWEYAHAIRGLQELGVVGPDSWALSVAGGREEPAFYLTNFVRWVFLVDMYGVGGFSKVEAEQSVLVNPDSAACIPFNRRRLVVQYMNALDLRFENDTFDAVLCLSSIEHFGGFDRARQALAEMHRVLKTGGIAALTTECIVNGKPDYDAPTLFLFSPPSLDRLIRSVPGLNPVEPIDYAITPASIATTYNLQQAVADSERKQSQYPHIAVQHDDRVFTSVAIFLRKN